MNVEIKVPEVGESITEGLLVAWSVEDGDLVAVDDPLFELETDKITLTVQAEQAGRLSILVEAESKVTVGQVVGRIDTEAAGAVARPTTAPAAAVTETGAPAPEPEADLDQLAPAVRRMVQEHDVDVSHLRGTGKGGRITKEDVLRHLGEDLPSPPPPPRPAPPASREPGERQTHEPLSPLRQRIAERLVQAQQTAAILTTFNEVDMSRVMAMRARHQEAFQERHGVKLGFMSFFVRAAVDALQHVPKVNAQIDGDQIIYNNVYDIGVAVGTDHGLVVPVIRDADRLGFAEIEAAIADFARRARERRLELKDLLGGTFTISNGGVYGSLLSTPILNPPQSGILGLHGIKKRPVVVEGDRIEARPMMYLALSYDHRLVDGKEAVTFLKHVVENIENPERQMERQMLEV